MVLNEKSEEQLKKLSFPLRQAANTLLRFLDRILNGKCDESEVAKFVAKKEFFEDSYHEKDFITVDECCRKLRCTRNNFYTHYIKKYKLRNYKFNNEPIGYKLSEILRIKKLT